jgi:hypothetical protein
LLRWHAWCLAYEYAAFFARGIQLLMDLPFIPLMPV